MPKNNGAARKAQRQGVAAANRVIYASRTPDEQFDVLDARDALALRERAHLNARLAQEA